MDDSTVRTYQDYTVGWICALPTEMAAARAMLDELHDPLQQDSKDDNNYTLGRIGGHNVVLAYLPAGVTGTISATRVVTQMLSNLKWLRFGLMVGIGGGVPSKENDIRLWDVVVSKPTGTFGGCNSVRFWKNDARGPVHANGHVEQTSRCITNCTDQLASKAFGGRPRVFEASVSPSES
jgi:hypothetical protein